MNKNEYDSILLHNSRELRKNMTREEKHLWFDLFTRLPLDVNRQSNLCGYIVDFYIESKKIVVEADGIQHTGPEHREADRIRDERLAKCGIKVLRYSNADIMNYFEAVCRDILDNLGLTFDDLK